ncbi:MAG: DUF1194 domain-containing protein [Proteobacteria bacterium]|nr:DUF1194 domain-containing protein [Pseudomonadota bacterium]
MKAAPKKKAPWAIMVALAILMPLEDARAEIPISLELVFAVDTSMSIDGYEFGLLMKGIANAFRTPEIVNLIGQQDGVAVTLFQWSSEINAQYMIPWHLLKDPASVLAFAAKVEKAERDPNRVFTGIGEAIDFGVRLIAENAFEGRRLKIDVSGDGRNNIGVSPAIPRRAANAQGIEINGLPILTRIVEYSARTSTTVGPMRMGRYQAHTNVDFFDLETYYRENVILGAGAFIEIANDYDDFARAFLRKLGREIAPLPISRAPPASRPLIRLAG